MRIDPHPAQSAQPEPEQKHGQTQQGVAGCPHCSAQTHDAPDAQGTSGALPESDCHCARTTRRDDREKAALISRCNRAEGQIRGIRGMLARDAYCDDILNQLQAASAALDAIGRLVLERHMKSCLIDRVQAGDLAVVDELLTTLRKMMR